MRASKRSLLVVGDVVLITVIMAGCGGYGSPTDPGLPTGVEGAIVTITPSGVDPKTVTIDVGQSVTFVNNDSVAHNMASDPFPLYSDCPAVNRVGNLGPAQRVATGAFTVARSCGYHDLLRNTDVRFQGTINIRGQVVP
jgi:plastocyanin